MGLNREQIEICQEEGVCHVCGKSIVWGVDAVYSIRGSHYDCEFPGGRKEPEKTLNQLFDDLGLGRGHYAHLSDVPALAWASGGQHLHWVIPNKNRALCGHQPKDTARHMKQRGKWLFLKDGTDVTDRKFCQKCVDKHKELSPKEQGD